MERIIIKKHKAENGQMYVLAMIYEGKEFVTWACDSEMTSFFWGHYFRDLRQALDDFDKRAEVIEEETELEA